MNIRRVPRQIPRGGSLGAECGVCLCVCVSQSKREARMRCVRVRWDTPHAHTPQATSTHTPEAHTARTHRKEASKVA